jgi:hypothetical protein
MLVSEPHRTPDPWNRADPPWPAIGLHAYVADTARPAHLCAHVRCARSVRGPRAQIGSYGADVREPQGHERFGLTTDRRRSPRRSLEPAASRARVAGRGEGEGLTRAASSMGAVRIRVGRRRGGRVPQGDDGSLACEPPPRPPENPASRGVRWRDALIWSISLGVGAAVSRLVAQRGAAAAWQAATGSRPPGLDDRAE